MVARRGPFSWRGSTPDTLAISTDLYWCISDWLTKVSGGTHRLRGADKTGCRHLHWYTGKKNVVQLVLNAIQVIMMGHYVVLMSDNLAVVACLNKHGGTISQHLYDMYEWSFRTWECQQGTSQEKRTQLQTCWAKTKKYFWQHGLSVLEHMRSFRYLAGQWWLVCHRHEQEPVSMLFTSFRYHGGSSMPHNMHRTTYKCTYSFHFPW